MELKLRGQFVAYVENREEAETLIASLQKSSFAEYQKFCKLYEETVDSIGHIREKGMLETNPEYRSYVAENYGSVLENMESLGRIMFPDGYEDIYFYNAKDIFAGYKFMDTSVPLTLLPLKAAIKFPKKDEFTIE